MMTKIAGCRLRIKRCEWSIQHYREMIKNPPTIYYRTDYAADFRDKHLARLKELKIELTQLKKLHQ